MRTKMKLLASLALCAMLATSAAFARDNDKDKDHSARPRVVRHHDRDRDHDRARSRRHYRERREARDRDRRRDHRQSAFYGNTGQPSGWTQGRKRGWRDCDMPPGQAKKYGCNSTRTYGHRDRDGDRD